MGPSEGTPPLEAKLAQFRKALEDEMEAARRSAPSGGIPLTDGRRIAKVGSQFQYAFTLESALDAPDGAPCDLHVAQRAPLQAIVLSVEGLRVALSVSADLGGFVPQAKLVTNLAFLLQRLIERIEVYADRPNPAGARVLGDVAPSGARVDADLEAKLNPEQRQAVLRALGYDTTFLWGPPGTGKTWTIGNMGAELYCRHQSVLLVSHTNTAVDGAVLKVADALGEQLMPGAVLRVGQPKVAQLIARPELLLQTEVDRRSEEMKRQLEALRREQSEKTTRVLEIQRLLDLLEWRNEARSDLDAASAELQALQALEAVSTQASERHRRLHDEAVQWRAIRKKASATVEDERNCLRNEDRITNLQLSRRQLQKVGAELDARVREAERCFGLAQEAAPLRARATVLPKPEVQETLVQGSRLRFEQARGSLDAVKTRLAEAEAIHAETKALGFLTRRWRGLPSPEAQAERVQKVQTEQASAVKAEAAAYQALERDAAVFQEVMDLWERLRPYAAVPGLDEAAKALREANEQSILTTKRLAAVEEDLARVLRDHDAVMERLMAFRTEHGVDPGTLLQRADEHEADLQHAEVEVASLRRQAALKRDGLEETLARNLSVVREVGLTREPAGSAESMLTALEEAYKFALHRTRSLNPEPLRGERDRINERLRAIEGEIASLEEALKRVEEVIIAEAKIIATTLTTAYLRDAIQARRFDMVILDEASMALIPALWVAAGLADRAAVVVGDFRQLPPIVQAKSDAAREWLGTDIFDKARMIQAWEAGRPPEHFMALREQFRMHPAISAVPNTLVYHGLLVDADEAKRDGDLFDWYDRDWGHNTPVLLLDTGSLNAWVTSVARGSTSSRVNFLSATVCADLAATMLKPDRPEPDAMRHRILAISPYRPHAQLLRLLLKDLGLQDEVLAGTTHQFQGQEADVVIFDLVNDEPHRKVALFAAKYDKQNQRLLNVALTRARRRLVVVGDFDYNRSTGKNAFLGRDLIPFLLSKYLRIDVLDVLPAGLAARAARAAAKTLGEGVEVGGVGFAVTQEHYFRLLVKDIATARSRIVVYSPFMTPQRLGMLQVHLRAAQERGVRIYVVTKPLQERDGPEIARYRSLERTLADWGITVLHKMGMHEKVVVIDDDVLWQGSLNTLSHRDTQEIMERRQSDHLVAEYVRVLCMEELLQAKDNGEDRCSICKREVVADEGRDQPFYWRCVRKDGFTRSIGESFVRDEFPICDECKVPYLVVERKGKFEWRCPRHSEHRQVLRPLQIRLPSVRAHLPPDVLHALDVHFGNTRPDQQELFDSEDEDRWVITDGEDDLMNDSEHDRFHDKKCPEE